MRKPLYKYVITMEGSELARGGGGCRCMTMLVARKAVGGRQDPGASRFVISKRTSRDLRYADDGKIPTE